MIGKDKTVDKFYADLCHVLCKKRAYPDDSMIGIAGDNEICRGCGLQHDYSLMHEIATMFWEHAPEITPALKRTAEVHGFDIEALHETMLAVFIGGGDCAPFPKTP